MSSPSSSQAVVVVVVVIVLRYESLKFKEREKERSKVMWVENRWVHQCVEINEIHNLLRFFHPYFFFRSIFCIYLFFSNLSLNSSPSKRSTASFIDSSPFLKFSSSSSSSIPLLFPLKFLFFLLFTFVLCAAKVVVVYWEIYWTYSYACTPITF